MESSPVLICEHQETCPVFIPPKTHIKTVLAATQRLAPERRKDRCCLYAFENHCCCEMSEQNGQRIEMVPAQEVKEC